MKVLLDEDVPQPLARALPEHTVHTVAGQGCLSIKNGKLLTLIDEAQFGVFITGDKNMSSQQSLVGRSFAVLILSAISWPIIKQHLPEIAKAVAQATLGTAVVVNCGTFVPSRWRSS